MNPVKMAVFVAWPYEEKININENKIIGGTYQGKISALFRVQVNIIGVLRIWVRNCSNSWRRSLVISSTAG